MALSLLGGAILGVLVCLGLGWGIASRLALTPSETIGASGILSGLSLYALSFLGYLASWPHGVFALLGPLALVSVGAGYRALRLALADEAARCIVIGVVLITVYCLLLDWTIPSYSGGTWYGDFYEHWERAQYWLNHAALGTPLLGEYSITSRPPLVNLEASALLAATEPTFAHFQIAMASTAVLAFLPAALIALRWGGARAVNTLTVACLVSPVFLANATFTWTKLHAASWVLGSLYFLLRAQDSDAPKSAALLSGLSMGAGIIAHYSAVPYAIAFLAAWVWRNRREPWFLRRTLEATSSSTAVISTWALWALANFGVRGTLFSTSTTLLAAPSVRERCLRMLGNAFDSLVPTFWFSGKLGPYLVQANRLGYLRDRWFQLAHSNLFVSVGCLSGLYLLALLGRAARAESAQTRTFWAGCVGLTITLGIAVNSGRDYGGCAHLCLVGISLLGSTYLCAHWGTLPSATRAVLLFGLAVDFLLGVVLQFVEQSWIYDRWRHPGLSVASLIETYSFCAIENARLGQRAHIGYLHEAIPFRGGLCLALLVGVLALAVWRLRATTRPRS